MADVVKFPGAPSDRELNDDGDRPHAEAFRDLEPEVCDLERMGDIAQDLIMQCGAREDSLRKLELAAFAVSQLAKMTRDFREIYYKRYHGELVSRVMKRRRRSIRKRNRQRLVSHARRLRR